MIGRITACLLVVPTVCLSRTVVAQGNSVSAYTAAKDSATRWLHSPAWRRDGFASVTEANAAAMKDLERRLRTIVGPFQAKGFPGPGYIAFGGLFGEEGDGQLDALWYGTAQFTSFVRVTTQPLLAAWLSRSGRGVPRDPIRAFGSEDFYTAAIESDSRVIRYATVHVPDAARQGIIEAWLVAVTNGDPGLEPEELIVSVMRGARIFIVSVPVAVKVKSPLACRAVRDSINAIRLPMTNNDRADAAFLACYADRAPRDPDFHVIVAQVEALVAALPPR